LWRRFLSRRSAGSGRLCFILRRRSLTNGETFMFRQLVCYLSSMIQSRIHLRGLSILLSLLLASGFEAYSLYDDSYKRSHTYKYSQEWSDTMENTATDWFHDAKYGIFVHYLYASQTDFESFDAGAFAAAVHETGAKYVIMTLGQNSGWFCSPNETYENAIGAAPGTWCSRRDIPMEAADALAPYGIKLMLYLPSQGPSAAGDKIPLALGAEQRHDETNWYINRVYAGRWAQVIREWAGRYGEKVAGWWFDGFYEGTGYAGEMAEYVSRLYKDACRSGNPDSIVAFNQGVMNGLIKPATAVCDYTAGEENTFEYFPSARFYSGAQWQILSYLGSWWGALDLKYDSGYLAQYAMKVIRAGGVITFEIHINADGSFVREQTDELDLVKKAVYSHD